MPDRYSEAAQIKLVKHMWRIQIHELSLLTILSYTSKSKQLFQMNSFKSSEEEPAEAQSVWDDVSKVPWYFLKT